MQYALVHNVRQEAFKGGSGTCPTCGAGMIAKCGNRMIRHWAHAHRENCDPWWENETQWHRSWKNLFPEEWREVSHTASDGEIHRADIKTSAGIAIEFQHSFITDGERQSRERFYKKLIWVIDGNRFRHNFDILHALPNPKSGLAKDLVWIKGSRKWAGAANGIFWRLSENPGLARSGGGMVEIHSFSEIAIEVNKLYCGHHQYDWIRPHKTWLDAACPVYIDLGVDCLARLETYDESGLPCVRLISKQTFLQSVESFCEGLP